VIELFDSHAHLQEPEFEEDLDAVIIEAAVTGVRGIVLPGEDVTTSQRAAIMAERLEGVYAAAGFHPHEASRLSADGLAGIEKLLSHRYVVAVGEIGLDFYRMHSTVEEQLGALEAQLELAAKHQLPVIIHCRDAWEAMGDTLQPWARSARSSYGSEPIGVLHYFSSDVVTAQRYVESGFLISVHTSVTHPKSTQLREVAAQLPLESLVIETDSPYGAPQAYRGQRNQPAYVIEAAGAIARQRGMDIDEVGAATTANARRLFRLDPSGRRARVASTGRAP
jgi:TatD DNase family protein